MREELYHKLEILEQERGQIMQFIDDLNEEDLHDNSYGWTIIQVFSHLNIAESGSIMYMKKKMQAGDKMPEFSFLNKIRLSLAKRLLQSSLKWKAPKVVGNPNGDYTLKEINEKWSKTRDTVREYVDEYPEQFLKKAVFKHPFAGRLNLSGAIDSFIYHQRHHEHQIKRIKRKIKK